MTSKQKLQLALTVSAFAGLPLGCATSLVPPPNVQAVGNPYSLVSVMPGAAGVIEVGLNSRSGAFKTQTEIAKVAADVLFYNIELIPEDGTPSNWNDNTGGTPYNMAGDQSNTSQMNPPLIADGNKTMRFVSVPNGAYRVRVQAMSDVNVATDSDSNPTGNPQDFSTNTMNQSLMVINKNDPANSAGPGASNGAQAVAVSINNAIISAGPQGAPPLLNVNVNLLDAKDDAVDVGLNVYSGNGSTPPTEGTDI